MLVVVPYFWSSETPIPNLRELQDLVRTSGGAIIEYERVASVGIYSQRTRHFEWIATGRSRSVASLKYVAVCLFLGWWSPAGLLWNMAVIPNNLAGGLDVTASLMPSDGPAFVGNGTIDRDLRRQGRLQNMAKGAFFLFIVVAMVWGVKYAK